MLLPSRRQLHALSRDPRTLRQAVLIIAGAFFLTALWLGVNRRSSENTPKSVVDQRGEALQEVLLAKPLDRVAVVRVLRNDARRAAQWLDIASEAMEDGNGEEQPGPDDPLPDDAAGIAFSELPALLAGSDLTAAEQQGFRAYHEALLTKKIPPDLIRGLEGLAMPEAPELPQTMAADLLRAKRDYQGALAAYEAVGVRPGALEARRRAVDLAFNQGWDEVAARLLAQPAYYEAVHAVPDGLSDRVAEEQLDIKMLFRRTLAHTASSWKDPAYLLLSLLSASVWFFSLHKACRVPRRQWWLGLVGIPLGMFSTVITLVLLSLQEARQGLADSDAAGGALLFQIASVGLREEFSKLLCFLPLLFFLRKATPAQALMAASSVGLGFALEENVAYYYGDVGGGVVGRFITANFLHLAMTGLTGHALFRFLRYPKNYGPAFIATFVCMVLVHGFYNYSLGGFDDAFSRELRYLVSFIVAGLAWFYFQTVRQEQDDAPQNLSAEAVFLLGTTVLVGTLLNYLVWEGGWNNALHSIIPAALSSVIFCWMFHYHLRNA